MISSFGGRSCRRATPAGNEHSSLRGKAWRGAAAANTIAIGKGCKYRFYIRGPACCKEAPDTITGFNLRA